MKIYFHVVTHDSGLAPNPFQGLCTQALCTPSHMNANLQKDDWLLGVSSAINGLRSLVYAMEISEVVYMAEYVNNPKYNIKRPKVTAHYKDCCGDNIYKVAQGGSINLSDWSRQSSAFHQSGYNFRKDIGERKNSFVRNQGKGNKVYVSSHYHYYGCARSDNWEPLQSIISAKLARSARGIRKLENAAWEDISETISCAGGKRNLSKMSKGIIYGWPKDAASHCPYNNNAKATVVHTFTCHKPAGSCLP